MVARNANMLKIEQGSTEDLTVQEALAERAGRLQEVLAWARVRLERAEALAKFSAEPDCPGGCPRILDAAEALGLIDNAMDGVAEALAENRRGRRVPCVDALVVQALERYMTGETEAETDRFDMGRVAGLTVGELRQQLSTPPVPQTVTS